MSEILLLTVVFFPFVAGLAAYTLNRGWEGKTGAGKHIETGSKVSADGKGEGHCGVSGLTQAVSVLCMLLESGILIYLCAQWIANADIYGFALYAEILEICGFGLHFTLDGFRFIYVLVAGLMWTASVLLSAEYFKHHHKVGRFYLFLFWTLGATLGVFLSADLYTTFIFFEIMSFTSYAWVAQEENRPALSAAATYLAVAVIGGLVMLMGIFMLYNMLGTLRISELMPAAAFVENRTPLYVAGFCMLFGFGAKAGAFPLHIWLPKAHPVAPAPGSALLSGILTKTGIYGILVLGCNLFFHDTVWGSLILTLGVITMFGGALLAVFSIDLKRTLACSSMSQIGFILIGIGMQSLLEENQLAAHGTVLHMVNHSLIKLVLFLAAGVIYMNTHALDLNVIRGFGRKKPLLAGCFLVGALTIGGIPLFGGYVSKTLLHESIVEYGGSFLMTAVEWIFLLSGGMTIAYMTKLFLAIFVEENADKALQKKYDQMKSYWNLSSRLAVVGSAVLLFVWGLVPGVFMNRAADFAQSFLRVNEYGEEVHYFSLENLKGAGISIVLGTLIYVFIIRRCLRKVVDGKVVYVNAWPKWLDLENLLYRPILLTILPTLFGILCRLVDCFADTVVVVLRKTLYKDSPLPHELPEGNIVTELVGHVLNGFEHFGNLFRKDHPHNVDYVHRAALRTEQMRENHRIIGRSLSFGLLLFGLGLSLTLLYLILS